MGTNDFRLVVDKVFPGVDRTLCLTGQLEKGEIHSGDVLTCRETFFKMSVDRVFINSDRAVSLIGRLEQGEVLPGNVITDCGPAPFLMAIEDVFSIVGQGTIVTGRVESGTLHVDDSLQIVGLNANIATSCARIEKFRRLEAECKEGDTVGILVRGVNKSDLKRGMVLASPGSVCSHSKFVCECCVKQDIDEAELVNPITADCMLKFLFRTAEVVGKVEFLEEKRPLSIGRVLKMQVSLPCPVVMSEGFSFGVAGKFNKLLMSGFVTEILE